MKNTKEKTAEVPQPEGLSAEEMAAAAGAGLENVVSGRDTQIPFLQIIQSGSPVLKRENTKYIPEAKAGDILNTVSGKLYQTYEPDGKPLIVIPVGFVHVWVEWKLRNLGGGFVKNHKDEMILASTMKGGPKGKDDVMKDNPQHHIVSTALHSVIVVDEEGNYPAVIGMTSTQLKKSRKWNTQMGAIKLPGTDMQAPTFYKRYAVKTGIEKWAEGDSYGWIINVDAQTDPAMFREAFATFKKMQSQTLLPAPPTDEDMDEPQGTESPGSAKGPF